MLMPAIAVFALFVLGGDGLRGTAAGPARLVAVERLEPAGAMCAWGPGRPSAVAASQTPAARAVAGTSCAHEGCADVAARQPLRSIQDPYPGFSAIAVDPVRNEVVLIDEFHSNILVYDRLAHTPPSAPRTEPKRAIGGPRTRSQYVSSVYVDPTSGDIYAVNNDSLVSLNVFGREAGGNVSPDRHLTTPYGSFGMAVDEEQQELFLTVQHDGAVVVWPKTAQGDRPPRRLLQGDRTHLADPHDIVLDPTNELMFIANYGTSRRAEQRNLGPGGSPLLPRILNWPAGNLRPRLDAGYRHEVVRGTGHFGPPSIAVFPADAHGNTPPLRVIEGPNAQLNWPTGISLDSERGELYVANAVGDSVAVFSATADGNVAPVRVLRGPRTQLSAPTDVFVDVVNDEVWVANFGNHMATVYARSASGDTPPLRVIRSAPLDAPTTIISNPFSIAYDSVREEILVPN